jgi:hypothetical protein
MSVLRSIDGKARPMRFGWHAASGSMILALTLGGYLSLDAAEPPAPPGGVHAAAAQRPVAAATPSERGTLDAYCVSCHNQRLRTGGLALDTVDVGNVGAEPAVWEKVARKLRAGAMPPPGNRRPPQATYDVLIASLESALDRHAAAVVNPGRTEALRRLTRTEYHHAIRDLLDLDVDVTTLLPGDAADRNGFDNMAGVLSISPALLQRYVSAAHKISRLAIGTAPIGPSVESFTVPISVVQDDRLNEDSPFGSRGGLAVRYNFPVDGEYEIAIKIQTNYVGYLRGMLSSHEVELRLDGARVRTFAVGGQAPGRPAPASYEGNIFGSTEWEDYMHNADRHLRARLPVRAGPRLIGVAFPRERWSPEGVNQPRAFGFALAVDAMPDTNPALGSIEISGPYEVSGPGDTPSRRKVFVCRPAREAEEKPCADRILARLARLAYRRALTDADVEVLQKFFAQARERGSFDEAIGAGIERILSAPDFLFRIERDPAASTPGQPYRLSGYELASRLAFFLWSSLPDDQLLDVAASGRLDDPKVLKQQVERMLADERSKALVDNFFGQWLTLRGVRTHYPDPGTFPEFDDGLREAFERETDLFITSQLREDRSLVELLTADYTFLNERLARHYGISGVYGSRFRKVTLGEGHYRGGLLGHGSVLMVTSYPTRTSPVLRGKWLLENVLGTPPPPPPPNVPALPERGEGGKPATVRALLEQHRSNPICASCHAQMDPLGFALENFDAVGAWRTSDAGAPIDPSGAMADGTKLQGLAGLRSVLGGRREQFARTVAEKLLTYALGREVEYYDMPAIRAVTRAAAADGYRWSSVIMEIVRSVPFQMRRPGDGEPAASTVAARR